MRERIRLLAESPCTSLLAETRPQYRFHRIVPPSVVDVAEAAVARLIG